MGVRKSQVKEYVFEIIKSGHDMNFKLETLDYLLETGIMTYKRALKACANYYYFQLLKTNGGKSRQARLDTAIHWEVSDSYVRDAIYKDQGIRF